MKHFLAVTCFAICACAPAALAQKWEVGAGVGGDFYTSQTVSNPLGKVDASLGKGLAVSAWLGNNTGNVLGGELRYDYEKSDLKLSGNGTSTSFGGRTQAFHYDFLFHLAPPEAPVRPYIAAGGGVKLYSGTGHEVEVQPLSDVAFLTKTNQVEGLISIGGGVKWTVGNNALLRLEVHDYITPFPKNVIAPAVGSKVGGLLQDFVVSVGLSFGI
jgi:hypothetical protein